MDAAPPQPKSHARNGCLVSLGIGLLTVSLVIGGIYLSGGRAPDLSEEGGFLLLYVLMVSAPFLLLTATGVTAKLPWAVGCALTALFWGYLFLDVVLINRGNGANIGLGLLGLVWPLIVAGGAFATAKATGTLPNPLG
jgi:hypothetical protein